jgi:hypothetical protein
MTARFAPLKSAGNSALRRGSAFAAAVALTMAGQDVTLRYRWNIGEPLRYRVTQTVMMTAPGAEMTFSMVRVVQMSANAIAADGTSAVRLLVESVRLDIVSPTGKVTFDGNAVGGQPADPMSVAMTKLMRAYVGESVVVVMTSRGMIQKVEGSSRIAEKVQQDTPEGAAALGLQVFDSIQADEKLRSTLAQGFAEFPDRALRLGDTWQVRNKIEDPIAGTIIVNTGLTFTGVENLGGRDVARIASTAMIDAMNAGDPSSVRPNAVSVGSGEVLFDRKNGCLYRATLQTVIPMSRRTTTPDGRSMTQQGSTTSTTTFELIEK